MKEQKGFAAGYALATFGAFFAVMAPTQGGLSAKVQSLVGTQEATNALSLIMGAGFAFGALAQPVCGRFSDRTSLAMGKRKPWLLGGTLMLGISLIAAGLVKSTSALLVMWCIAQIAMNVFLSATQTAVADGVPENRRGAVTGWGAAAVPLAIFSSIVVLDWLPTDEMRFVIPAIIGIALCVFPVLLFRDTTAHLPIDRIGLVPLAPLSVESVVPGARRIFWEVCGARILIVFGYASVTSYLLLYFAAAFKMSIDEQLHFNVFATGASVVTMTFGAVAGGILSDKLGNRHLFVLASGTAIALGVGILAIAPLAGHDLGLGIVIVSQVFVGVGFGLFVSVGTALGIDLLPDPRTKARDIGLLNLSNAVPGVVVPFFAASLVIPYGEKIQPGWGFSLWFLVAAAVSLMGGLLCLRLDHAKIRERSL